MAVIGKWFLFLRQAHSDTILTHRSIQNRLWYFRNLKRIVLLDELERLLVLERQHPNASGYVSLEVEERDLPLGKKHDVSLNSTGLTLNSHYDLNSLVVS